MSKKIDGIVYTSNAGHTKEYAQMLSSELGIPSFDLESCSLAKGSNIIYMGWLMAGKVKGYPKASKKYNIKALCGVGMSAYGNQIPDIINNNNVPTGIPVYGLQGGFELEKLSGLYKIMMSAMKKGFADDLSKKENRTPEEDEMLDLVLHGGNKVNRNNLEEIIAWYRG